MIANEEIIKIIKDKNLIPPEHIKRTASVLKKSLWILAIVKDNTPASALSPQAISELAHKLLDEDIKKNSISKSFSRAGKKVKKIGESFYEIMGPGRAELDEFDFQKKFRERFYDSGEQFDFYKDMKEIVSSVQKEIFIVDSYVDEDLLNIYIEKAKLGIKIRILTNSRNPKGNFIVVAKMFAKKQGVNFEARESLECHDRAFFTEDCGFVLGNSIKNNAKNKPAYLIRLDNPSKLEKSYQRIWNSATKIV